MHCNKKDFLLIFIYIVFGVLTRTVWHIAPNVEFVTAFAIAGAYFIRKSYSAAIPLGIMVISDFLIGNTAIYLFTWSAFGIAWILGKILASERIKEAFDRVHRILKLGIMSEMGGVIFTLFFYLWTNFGVVVVSNLYPKTLEGLLLSYKMGLPFLVPQLLGNALIVPAIFIFTELTYNGKLRIFLWVRQKIWVRR